MENNPNCDKVVLEEKEEAKSDLKRIADELELANVLTIVRDLRELCCGVDFQTILDMYIDELEKRGYSLTKKGN